MNKFSQLTQFLPIIGTEMSGILNAKGVKITFFFALCLINLAFANETDQYFTPKEDCLGTHEESSNLRALNQLSDSKELNCSKETDYKNACICIDKLDFKTNSNKDLLEQYKDDIHKMIKSDLYKNRRLDDDVESLKKIQTLANLFDLNFSCIDTSPLKKKNKGSYLEDMAMAEKQFRAMAENSVSLTMKDYYRKTFIQMTANTEKKFAEDSKTDLILAYSRESIAYHIEDQIRDFVKGHANDSLNDNGTSPYSVLTDPDIFYDLHNQLSVTAYFDLAGEKRAPKSDFEFNILLEPYLKAECAALTNSIVNTDPAITETPEIGSYYTVSDEDVETYILDNIQTDAGTQKLFDHFINQRYQYRREIKDVETDWLLLKEKNAFISTSYFCQMKNKQLSDERDAILDEDIFNDRYNRIESKLKEYENFDVEIANLEKEMDEQQKIVDQVGYTLDNLGEKQIITSAVSGIITQGIEAQALLTESKEKHEDLSKKKEDLKKVIEKSISNKHQSDRLLANITAPNKKINIHRIDKNTGHVQIKSTNDFLREKEKELTALKEQLQTSPVFNKLGMFKERREKKIRKNENIIKEIKELADKEVSLVAIERKIFPKEKFIEKIKKNNRMASPKFKQLAINKMKEKLKKSNLKSQDIEKLLAKPQFEVDIAKAQQIQKTRKSTGNELAISPNKEEVEEENMKVENFHSVLNTIQKRSPKQIKAQPISKRPILPNPVRSIARPTIPETQFAQQKLSSNKLERVKREYQQQKQDLYKREKDLFKVITPLEDKISKLKEVENEQRLSIDKLLKKINNKKLSQRKIANASTSPSAIKKQSPKRIQSNQQSRVTNDRSSYANTSNFNPVPNKESTEYNESLKAEPKIFTPPAQIKLIKDAIINETPVLSAHEVEESLKTSESFQVNINNSDKLVIVTTDGQVLIERTPSSNGESQYEIIGKATNIEMAKDLIQEKMNILTSESALFSYEKLMEKISSSLEE